MEYSPPSAKAEFRSDINALRAIAVLAVVLYHFSIPGVAGGFVGVDIFFVISGYLITAQIVEKCASNSFSFYNFYIARIRRIFPALALMCAVCVAWGWYFVLPTDYISQIRHAAAAVFFVSNQAFAGERGYFDASALSKPLLHTWSLSIEGQFYVFLPIAVMVTHRFWRRYLAAIAMAALLASLAWCLLSGRNDPGAPFYQLLARAWELLAGSVLAIARLRKPHPTVAKAGTLLALVGLFASITLLNKHMVWPGLWTLLPVGSAVLFLAMQDAPLPRALLNNWALQRTGDISYSLYLWHWPLLIFMHSYVASMDRDLSATELAGLLLASVVLAALSWRFVELPTRFNRQWWPQQRVWRATACTELLFLAVGLAIVASHGAPERLPSYVRRATDAVFVNTPRDECFRRGDSTKDAKEPFCTFGAAQAAPSILLWGDSHANQYLTAVTQASSTLGMQGLIATQSACSAAQAKRDNPPPSQLSCDRFNLEVLQMLEHTPSLHIVVLGRFWGPSDVGNVSANVGMVQKLVGLGKKVILVGPLPYPGFNVPYEWSTRQIKAGHGIESITLPRASQNSVAEMNDGLATALRPSVQDRNAVYIDVFQQFCDAASCRLIEEGISNFRDDSHLSETGAAKMAAAFQAAFETLKK
jgi:peptidoglycan/LPS O-acetylase OafA/YrhL